MADDEYDGARGTRGDLMADDADARTAICTVVELAGDPAGEMLGKLLAELGADVVKVEPPEGSPTRAIGPFADDHDDADHSLTFWYYNTNKRSVVARRPRPPTAGRACSACSPTPTSCITTLAPAGVRRARPRRRRRSRDASARSDRRVDHPFGLDGPWADWLSSDLVGLALGSPLNSCGYDDHSIPPIRPGGDQGYQSAASFALMASDAGADRAPAHRSRPAGRRRHARLPGGQRRAGQPVLVLPAGRRAPSDLPPRPADAHSPALFQCGDDRYVYFVMFVADLKPWRTLVEWMSTQGPRRRPQRPGVRRPRLPAGELRAHPGAGRGVLPAPDGRRGVPRRPGARAADRGRSTRPTTCSTTSTCAARDFFVTVEHDDVPPARVPRRADPLLGLRPGAHRRAPRGSASTPTRCSPATRWRPHHHHPPRGGPSS